jgi:diguanylate cyclase (GGDEF)-like protein
LQATLRVPLDAAARFGGEEFVLLLPNANTKDACQIAERLRRRLAAISIDFQGERFNVTASFGVSEWRNEESDLVAALTRADLAVYAAKQNGRNQVCTSHCLQQSSASQPQTRLEPVVNQATPE